MNLKRLGWFVLLCCVSGALSAGVIYDNGAPNASDGNDATQWIQAEDFKFDLDTIVTDVHLYFAGLSGIGAWDGVADYWIFADTGDAPTAGAGGVLSSGTGQNLTVSDSGIPWCCGGNAYELSFDLLEPFNALAGTRYWLGAHLSGNYNRDDIYWVTTASNGTLKGQESINGTLDNWSSNDQEHAFKLTGGNTVPVPGTLALFVMGIAGLRWTRRKTA